MGALLEFSTALGYCLGQAPYSGIAPACGPYVNHFCQLLDTKAGRFMTSFCHGIESSMALYIGLTTEVYGIECTPICHER